MRAGVLGQERHTGRRWSADPRPLRAARRGRLVGSRWRRGGVATQRPAKPSTPVRFRSSPLVKCGSGAGESPGGPDSCAGTVSPVCPENRPLACRRGSRRADGGRARRALRGGSGPPVTPQRGAPTAPTGAGFFAARSDGVWRWRRASTHSPAGTSASRASAASATPSRPGGGTGEGRRVRIRGRTCALRDKRV